MKCMGEGRIMGYEAEAEVENFKGRGEKQALLSFGIYRQSCTDCCWLVLGDGVLSVFSSDRYPHLRKGGEAGND